MNVFLFYFNAGPNAVFVGSTVTRIDDKQGTNSSDSEIDKIFEAVYYCAGTGLEKKYSRASITGHTKTTFSWIQVNIVHLVIFYTIYGLVPRPSADN